MKVGGCSQPGPVAGLNQDAWCADADRGWAIVADGVSGRPGGEVASGVAVEAMARALRASEERADQSAESVRLGEDAPRMLRAGVDLAARAVLELRSTYLLPPATTLAACWVLGERAFVVHLGDSRVYRVAADGSVEALTRDQALDGATAGSRPLVGCLGHEGSVDPELASVVLGPGDALVLVSDGVHGSLAPEEIGRLVRRRRGGASAAAVALVEAAHAAGGQDDATAVVLSDLTGRGEGSLAAGLDSGARTGRALRMLVSASVLALTAAFLSASHRNAHRFEVGLAESGDALVIERGLWFPAGRRTVERLEVVRRDEGESIARSEHSSLTEARAALARLAFEQVASEGASPVALERRARALRAAARVARLPEIDAALHEVLVDLAEHEEAAGNLERALAHVREARALGTGGRALAAHEDRIAERLAERYLTRARLATEARDAEGARGWLARARRLGVAEASVQALEATVARIASSLDGEDEAPTGAEEERR